MLPERGDIVWVELDPVHGTEQAGRRPALVLSAKSYHEISPRAVICPITSSIRDWPFNVRLPPGLRVAGVILVDQVRAIHREGRVFDIIECLPARTLMEVQGRLAALCGIEDIETQ